MNTINSSFIKALIAIIIVGVASFSVAIFFDNTLLFHPIHNANLELTDEMGDVSEPYIDIIKYGSMDLENEILLYLEVLGELNQSQASYSLIIVAKRPNEQIAHIYNIAIENGIDSNYGSIVLINESRVEVKFLKSNFIPNSYMVGIEARTLGIDEDTTLQARENPLITKILGIF